MTTSPPPNLVAAACAVAIAALSLYLLIVGEAIFVPLVLAVFIAYLIAAVAYALQSIRIGRWQLRPGLALTLALILFMVGVAILVQLVAGNIRDIVDAAPQYQARLAAVLERVNAELAATFNHHEPLTIAGLMDKIDLQVLFARIAGEFRAIAGNTIQIFIYVAFLLLEMRTFDRKMAAMFPDAERERSLRNTIHQIGRKIETYVWIKSAIGLAVAVLSYAVLAALDVDFAPFWALLLFILNFVPYIGPVVGVLFPTLLSMLQFESGGIFILVFAILAAIQAIVGNVVEPRLLGKSLNISPLVVIVGLSIWGAIWGITGMVLSVPIMVMTMIVFAQFPRTRPLAILMSEDGDIR